MVISSAGGTGKTTVSLAVFTKGSLTKSGGIDIDNEKICRVVGRRKDGKTTGTVDVTNAELNGLDPAFGKLFEGGGAKGRIFVIKGELDKFGKDLILSE
ncbi:hypothetical protein FACS189443_4660 [Planctomycetales bacterium]|nr:hypothetical protein FACS189443_4660 [Planctomycetales bacterium]